jgi:hypothetical protein
MLAPSPVTLPMAGVHVVCDAAVIRPFAFTVNVTQLVAEPKLPTFALTVASVDTPAAFSVQSPLTVRQIGAPACPTASCPALHNSDVKPETPGPRPIA